MPRADFPLRFVCDHDVDANVATALRRLGHDAWTAGQGAMSTADDETLAIYCDEKDAIVVTHDRRFSQGRRRFVTTRHIWLRCNEWEAADLLASTLPDLERVLSRRDKPAFITISDAGYEVTW